MSSDNIEFTLLTGFIGCHMYNMSRFYLSNTIMAVIYNSFLEE